MRSGTNWLSKQYVFAHLFEGDHLEQDLRVLVSRFFASGVLVAQVADAAVQRVLVHPHLVQQPLQPDVFDALELVACFLLSGRLP